MYRYKHNPLARPSRISWSNSELKNWNSKRDVFDTRRNPDRGIFVTIILVFLCCISCACVCTCEVCVCVCTSYMYIYYIFIYEYIYMYSFIHTFCQFSFSFVCLILSLFPHISVFIHLFIFFYDLWILLQCWTVIGNGWTESLSMKISFSLFSSHRDSNHFSTMYRFASFFYLSDFSNPLDRFSSSFKIFVPISRCIIEQRN